MAQPFAHDDLELKQHFIKLAREFHQTHEGSIEKELSSALLYMNVADYLAEYLVVGLTEMAKEAMGKYYLGVVTMQPQKREKLNIGSSMRTLQQFEFPRKSDILVELSAINVARIKIAHQVLKTKGQQLQEIDDAVASLAEHTELLVVLVDEISLGMPPQNMLQKLTEAQAQAVSETKSSRPVAKKPKSNKKT